jgi:hypothetical protein
MNAMPLTAPAPSFTPRQTDRNLSAFAVVAALALLLGLAAGALIGSRSDSSSVPTGSAGPFAGIHRTAGLDPETHAYGAHSAVPRPGPVPVTAVPAVPAVPPREAHFHSAELRARAAAARPTAGTAAAPSGPVAAAPSTVRTPLLDPEAHHLGRAGLDSPPIAGVGSVVTPSAARSETPVFGRPALG